MRCCATQNQNKPMRIYMCTRPGTAILASWNSVRRFESYHYYPWTRVKYCWISQPFLQMIVIFKLAESSNVSCQLNIQRQDRADIIQANNKIKCQNQHNPWHFSSGQCLALFIIVDMVGSQASATIWKNKGKMKKNAFFIFFCFYNPTHIASFIVIYITLYKIIRATILSDPSLANIFFLFFVRKNLCLSSKLDKPHRSTNFSMYIPTFCLNYVKCWFFILGPIVKFAHCKQYKCERSRMEFYYGHLMTKINIL